LSFRSEARNLCLSAN